MLDQSVPHMLAILFEDDDETGARSVQDIIRVEGTDRNAKRRLRRRVLYKLWPFTSVIRYESYDGKGDCIEQDVTRYYKKALG